MEHLGFFLFHILLFVLLFTVLWKAKNVSGPFKVFLTGLLVVLFVSPMYMRVRDLQANIIGSSDVVESSLTSTEEQPLAVQSLTYLPFALEDVRGLFPDATWTATTEETTGMQEELFRMSSGLFGVISSHEQRLTGVELALDTDAPRIVTALLDMQLALTKMTPELVESGWISQRVAQIRANPDRSYTDTLTHLDVLYTITYDPAQKKIIVRLSTQ